MLTPSYIYAARLIRIIDGDTIVVDLDLGFRIVVETPLRLFGVNAPEKKTQPGKEALAWTTQWCATAGALTLESAKPGEFGDKYGRYLATVYAANGRCLNVDILAAGHAEVMKFG